MDNRLIKIDWHIFHILARKLSFELRKVEISASRTRGML